MKSYLVFLAFLQLVLSQNIAVSLNERGLNEFAQPIGPMIADTIRTLELPTYTSTTSGITYKVKKLKIEDVSNVTSQYNADSNAFVTTIDNFELSGKFKVETITTFSTSFTATASPVTSVKITVTATSEGIFAVTVDSVDVDLGDFKVQVSSYSGPLATLFDSTVAPALEASLASALQSMLQTKVDDALANVDYVELVQPTMAISWHVVSVDFTESPPNYYMVMKGAVTDPLSRTTAPFTSKDLKPEAMSNGLLVQFSEAFGKDISYNMYKAGQFDFLTNMELPLGDTSWQFDMEVTANEMPVVHMTTENFNMSLNTNINVTVHETEYSDLISLQGYLIFDIVAEVDGALLIEAQTFKITSAKILSGNIPMVTSNSLMKLLQQWTPAALKNINERFADSPMHFPAGDGFQLVDATVTNVHAAAELNADLEYVPPS